MKVGLGALGIMICIIHIGLAVLGVGDLADCSSDGGVPPGNCSSWTAGVFDACTKSHGSLHGVLIVVNLENKEVA